MLAIAKDISKKERLQESSKKWGRDVVDLGFNVVPSLLFQAQARLGLNPTQLVLLLHLTDHWWVSNNYPWPAVQTLADRMGLKRRQVQRLLAELEKGKFIRRIERRAQHKGKLSNQYDLSGLVSKVQKLAPEFQEIKDSKKEIERPRGLRRKKDTGDKDD